MSLSPFTHEPSLVTAIASADMDQLRRATQTDQVLLGHSEFEVPSMTKSVCH